MAATQPVGALASLALIPGAFEQAAGELVRDRSISVFGRKVERAVPAGWVVGRGARSFRVNAELRTVGGIGDQRR